MPLRLHLAKCHSREKSEDAIVAGRPVRQRYRWVIAVSVILLAFLWDSIFNPEPQ
ncbi:hypothetical protein [Allocoleopsis franciscana]|uniref:hypothetical protein n=1 Tax=Allocoleopsis franciscana TaxID=2886352 RepID=UPI00155AEE91|nr:hypothetical protein [Allocoleopsis franciscana]